MKCETCKHRQKRIYGDYREKITREEWCAKYNTQIKEYTGKGTLYYLGYTNGFKLDTIEEQGKFKRLEECRKDKK